MHHRELARLRIHFRRAAKVQCSQIHKNFNMDVADDDDILANFGLANIAILYPLSKRNGRRGRRKFAVRSATLVAESGSDD